MALVVKDRVKEATTTTGTGTISLDGAATGFQTFVAGIGTTNTTYYAIVDNNTGDYEVGIGTITDATPDTLSRDTILESSNAGSAVNLQAGTKDVFCTYPAEKSVYLDSSGQLILDGTAITATASELNFVDGVTSSIQTQIDSFANSLEGVKSDYVYTATASQTVFSGADDNTNTLVIDLAGLVNVFLNGVRLIRDTDYTVSAAGDSITLTTGATVNDLLEVEVFGNFTGQSGAEVGITGGLIDGVDIGNTTAGDGTFVDLTATGTTTLAGATTSTDITFGDNDKAIFGAGSDLQIYHDGSSSRIEDSGTGNLEIRGDNLLLKSYTGGEAFFRGFTNGQVDLFYDGSAKLATTNTGIDVTGTVTADGLTVSDSNATTDGTDGVFLDVKNTDGTTSVVSGVRFLNGGTASYKGAVFFEDLAGDGRGDVVIASNDVASGGATVGLADQRLRISRTGDISFYEDTGATAKFFWDASAESLGIGSSPTYHFDTQVSDITWAARILNTNANGSGLLVRSDTTNDNIVLGVYGNGAYRMAVKGDGNVGIGTQSPAQSLHIKGNNTTAGYQSPGLTIEQDGTGDATINFLLSGTKRYLLGVDNSDSDKLKIFSDDNGDFTGSGITLDTAGNVGIGTTSPIRTLHVDSSSNLVGRFSSSATEGFIQLAGSGTGTAPRVGATGNNFIVYTNDAERMRIGSGGNIYFYEDTGTTAKFVWDASAERLGLGTTTPSHNIDVTSSQTASLRLDSTTYGADFILYSGATGADKFGIYDADASAYRLIIDNVGNVGIGTTSPSSELDVSSSDTTTIEINAGDANASRLFFGDTTNFAIGFINYEHSSDAMRFGVNNAERMRIDSSGNVGIGVTPPAWDAGFGPALHVGAGAALSTRSDLRTNLSSNLYIGSGPQNKYIANGFATQYLQINGEHRWYNAPSGTANAAITLSQPMTLDASGNLLVGKTVTTLGTQGTLIASGQIQQTKSAGAPLLANRTGSGGTENGTIIDIRSNSATVGSIASVGGSLGIGNGDTGFYFDAGSDSIIPCNLSASPAANRDNAIDIGFSTVRFKNLYLSGGLVLDDNPTAVGGSVTSKTLDDYEEGTWTPSGNGITFTTAVGKYTKIGRVVQYSLHVVFPSTANTTNASVNQLPFSCSSGQESRAGASVGYAQTGSGLYAMVADNTTSLFLYNLSGSNLGNNNFSTQSLYIGGTYITDS